MPSLNNDYTFPLNSPILSSSAHVFDLSQQSLLFTPLGYFIALAAFSRPISPLSIISLLLTSLFFFPGNRSIATSSMDFFFAFSHAFLIPSAKTFFNPPADLTPVLFHDNRVLHLLLRCCLVLTPAGLHCQQSESRLLLSPPLGLLLLPLQRLQHLLHRGCKYIKLMRMVMILSWTLLSSSAFSSLLLRSTSSSTFLFLFPVQYFQYVHIHTFPPQISMS